MTWRTYGAFMAVMLIVVVSSWGLEQAVESETMFGFPRWLHATVIVACVFGMGVHVWRGRER